MRVAISIAEHEIQMAHRWFDWIIDLCGTEGHHLHIIPSGILDTAPLIQKANKAFHGNVSIIKDEEEQTSDWQIVEPMRSASGPNSAFRQVAWHFHNNNLGPYFWCELDCIPLRKDWLDRLESEYKSCGKPFMGADVQIESVPPHMSGNGIYDNAPMNAPTLVMRTNWTPKGSGQTFELAFDIAGAREVLPKAHFTNLIQHKFRFKGFESRYEFDAVIDKNAVVFHSDKKGTIYKYLRENLSGVVHTNGKVDNRTCVVEEGGMSQTDSTEVKPPTAQNICTANPIQSDPHPPTLQPNEIQSPCVTSCQTTTVTNDELESVIAQQSVIRNGLPAMSPPWENREDTERDVKMLCDTLSLFCKAPIYKSRVRQALREAKIIK